MSDGEFYWCVGVTTSHNEEPTYKFLSITVTRDVIATARRLVRLGERVADLSNPEMKHIAVDCPFEVRWEDGEVDEAAEEEGNEGDQDYDGNLQDLDPDNEQQLFSQWVADDYEGAFCAKRDLQDETWNRVVRDQEVWVNADGSFAIVSWMEQGTLEETAMDVDADMIDVWEDILDKIEKE